MAKTQEEILQKVNEICSANNLSLMDNFKANFAKAKVALFDGDNVDEESIYAQFKISLEDSYHAFSQGASYASAKAKEEYEAKLAKQAAKSTETKVDKGNGKNYELPDEIKEDLKFVQEFRKKLTIESKREKVFDLASKDLDATKKQHFKTFFETQHFDVSGDDAEIAKNIYATYQNLFKMQIEDTSPKDSKGSSDSQLGGALGTAAAAWQKKNIINKN